MLLIIKTQLKSIIQPNAVNFQNILLRQVTRRFSFDVLVKIYSFTFIFSQITRTKKYYDKSVNNKFVQFLLKNKIYHN